MHASEGLDPPAEIVAALVLDLPLLRAGSGSARDFANAMSGRLGRPESEHGRDPLGRAAQAITLERRGQAEQALPIYRELATDESSWVGVLGRMLLAWSEASRDLDALLEAQSAADEVDAPDELRARLHTKVATFALDFGHAELAREALRRAVDLAPEGGRLRRALAVEAFNAGLEVDHATLSNSDRVPAQDALVDYPWIHYEALGAATDGLTEDVERAAQRIWSWTLRFGGTTPLDKAAAAEMQATWAGALWLRRPIRLQLGAQLLNGEASHPAQWGYGVLMWVLGGGKNPERIFRLAEPYLDQAAVDFAVRNVFEADWPQTIPYRALMLASEAADCLSDGTLRWLAERFDPQPGDHPLLLEVHRLWAIYAARLPREWLGRFAEQPRDIQAALLSVMGTATVARLTDEDKEILLSPLLDALRSQEAPDDQLLRLATALAPTNARGALTELVTARARPEVIAALTRGGDVAIVSTDALERARDALFASVTEAMRDARNGRVSFGPRDPRLDLASVLTALPPDIQAVELLGQVASDPELPGEHILAARNGLAVLRYAGKLPESEVSRWHNAVDPLGTMPEHGGVTVELVAMRRLQIIAPALSKEETVQVVTGTRSTDKRVRLVSIEVCAEAARAAKDPDIRDASVWALVGALFDPLDEVIASAVRTLSFQLKLGSSTASEVVFARLPRLFDIGSTDVREAVVETAADLGVDTPEGMQEMLLRARADKSWRVREATRGRS